LAPFSDKYALFAFGLPGDITYYGWIHLSYSVNPQFGPDPTFGPDLTIQDWAYSDYGGILAAGSLDDSPEPATAVSTGLAALALGAVGLRNWRKTRKAA
jgi:hypothetical protein